MLTNNELLNEIYKKMWQDEGLAALLGNPKTPQEKRSRIIRGVTPLSYATADHVNFINLYLSSATETDNLYVVRAFLNVDYYGRSHADLMKMSQIVSELLQKMDIFCTSMYDIPSDTKGVYRYTQKFRPLVWA